MVQVLEKSRENMRQGVVWIVIMACSINCHAQQLELVKDINQNPSAQNLQFAGKLNNKLIFRATTIDQGSELWTSDGSPAGTHLIKDIRSGSQSSHITHLVAGQNLAYFLADDGLNGLQFWRTAGDTGSTQIVTNLLINPGTNFRYKTAVFQDKLVFEYFDNTNGYELWINDGSPANSTLIKDIYPGNISSNPKGFYVYDEELYFGARDDIGNGVWKTDGTSSGTKLVKYIDLAFDPEFITYNGEMYFTGSDSTNDFELWKTNGTSNGTILVKDINPGINGSGPRDFAVANGELFFAARRSSGAYDLWKTNGTSSGTILVKPSSSSSLLPEDITSLGSKVIFSGQVNDREPWISDGTDAGTFLLTNIWSGLNSDPRHFTNVEGNGFFIAENHLGYELYTSDGTQSGTYMVTELCPGPEGAEIDEIFSINNLAMFAAKTPTFGNEWWTSDGSSVGTNLVKDINAGTQSASILGLRPDIYSLDTLLGKLAFLALDQESNRELYLTDGTENGTFKLYDFHDVIPAYGPDAFEYNNMLFINGGHVNFGRELWISDGTTLGTSFLKDIYPGLMSSNPTGFTEFGNELYFSATSPSGSLWKTDGTSSGTIPIKDFSSFDDDDVRFLGTLNGNLIFSAKDDVNGNELWQTNGTSSGTQLVKDINPGSSGSFPFWSFIINSVMYFSAADGTTGRELWKTDGTSSGTYMIKDLYPGVSFGISGNKPPPFFVELNNKLVFVGRSIANGYELWTSDGTSSGTQILHDIWPGPGNGIVSSDELMWLIDNILYFAADDGIHGVELWRTDGTVSGTYMLGDLAPGNDDFYIPSQSYYNAELITFDNKIIFSNHESLWISDGTNAGTTLLADSVNVYEMINYNDDYVYMKANPSGPLLEVNGVELWRTDGTVAGTNLHVDHIEGAGSGQPSLLTIYNDTLFCAINSPYGNELHKLIESLQCTHADFTALQTFYNSTTGDSWTNNSGWLSNCDPCTWFGISCNTNGRVNGIDLQVNNLSGQLPEQLSELEFLSQLKLGVNSLSGNIPFQLGGLLFLENLWLHNNNYTGSGLPLFTNLNDQSNVFPSLDRLYLYNNNFLGTIPPIYADYTNLTVIRMYNNPALEGCYESELLSLCDQLTNNQVGDISGGTNFESAWEDFCQCNAGICACNETNIWIGGNSTWDNPTNWSLGHVPLACEIIEIKTVGNVVSMPSNYSSTIYLIDVGANCELEIPATSTLHVLADPGFNNWTNCN